MIPSELLPDAVVTSIENEFPEHSKKILKDLKMEGDHFYFEYGGEVIRYHSDGKRK